MSTFMRGNLINVYPGQSAFNLMTNLCDYFELGNREGNDVWLEGQIVDGEFIFNGRLFLHDGSFGTVIDSFPKGPAPQGWTQRRRMDAEGYELVDSRGERIFSYHIEGKICFVDVNLYTASGQLAAHSGQDGFVTNIRTRLGRSGMLIG